jgi:signal transduction histidine kinase
MRSAKTLVRRLFVSLGAVYVVSSLAYGFLAVAEFRRQRDIADLEATLVATELIVANEIFAGNLLIAKEKIAQLMSQGTDGARCLRLTDARSQSSIMVWPDGEACRDAGLELKREVYFDEAKNSHAFTIQVSASSVPSGLLGNSAARWIFALVPLVLTLAATRIVLRRFDQFIAQIRGALESEFENQRYGGKFEFEEVSAIRSLVSAAKEVSKLEAIASTTQALAHDVRRPFAIFRSIIETIERQNDSTEAVRTTLREALPEVSRPMIAVDGLLQDVLQVGSDTKPLLEEVDYPSLIFKVLADTFKVFPLTKVNITKELCSHRSIMVDPHKIERVFANILTNAIQASAQTPAQIWIRTEDVDDRVQFTLGNAGSFISDSDLPKLFDAFFTSGKRGGTGLGLAIAKKIVEMHGGEISCRSSRDAGHPGGKVEFVFTLPAGSRVLLPEDLSHSTDCNSPSEAPANATSISSRTESPQLKSAGRLTFACVEDSIAFLVGMREASKQSANMLGFKTPSEFWAWAQEDAGRLSSLAFVITDYDFGLGQALTGTDLALDLRRMGYAKPVYLSSLGTERLSEEQLRCFTALLPKGAAAWLEVENRHVSV